VYAHIYSFTRAQTLTRTHARTHAQTHAHATQKKYRCYYTWRGLEPNKEK